MHKNTQKDNKTFDEFVSRQHETDPETALIDWEKERDQWLAHLDRLYSTVESFLAKYVRSGQIRYEYRPVELNEENIGSYSAKQMVLRIGRQEVDLVPIGTLLIGSKGRVDVRGPAGRAQLLLVDSKVSDPQIADSCNHQCGRKATFCAPQANKKDRVGVEDRHTPARKEIYRNYAADFFRSDFGSGQWVVRRLRQSPNTTTMWTVP